MRVSLPRLTCRPVVLLVALWTVPNLVLVGCLHRLFHPALGLAMHACILLAGLLAMVLPAWAVSRLGRIGRCAAYAVAPALASVQWVLLMFYVLSVVSVRTWGNWLDWTVVHGYIPQMVPLLRALGYSWPMALLVAGLPWALLLALYLKLAGPVFAAFDHAIVRDATGRGVRAGRGERLAWCVLLALGVFVVHAAVTDRAQWCRSEPLEIALSSNTPYLTGLPSMADPVLQAREARDVAAYLAAHPKAAAPRPLVLITVDALRSDQMGVYGGPVDDTPFLSSQVQQGRMQRMGPTYSTSTWSYGGLLGVLSSKYLHQITPQPWNLADALKHLGYATCFLLCGDHTHFVGLRWMYGPDIDVYRDGASQTEGYVNDDKLVVEWLARETWPAGKPVFLFLHLMSVHQMGALEPEFQRWERKSAAEAAASGSPPDRNQALRDRYHDRVLQADARLRQIFALLDGNPVFRNALVIITADHGEYLGEFGRTSHGGAPYEAVTRVPLLIRDPSGTVYPPRALSSLVDIAPTFLTAIGAPIPANWAGIPLQSRTGRDALVVEYLDVSGLVGSCGGRRYKYFANLGSGTESLFDLDSSAGETRDLVAHPVADAGEAKRDGLALAQLRREHAALTGPLPSSR